MTRHYKALAVFKSCLSLAEYLLRMSDKPDCLNPLAKREQPLNLQRREQTSAQRSEHALKMVCLIFLNISRTLELKGHCYFAEVTARTAFFNMEDAGFHEKDEMVDFIGNFYNFIKEKVGRPH